MKDFQGNAREKKSLTQSFVFAGRGIGWVMATQKNMRIHLGVAAAVLAAAAWFKIGIRDLALIVFAIALVLVAEMVNSAVEKTVDLAAPDYHPAAGLAKDAAAGAVLLAAFFSVIIGLLVFIPYVKKWLAQIMY
ncbi:MAG: diacylglycerol kinase family protein [Peptococcaceae bacterium]|nr:diacylglycerol kinase family protein [Peptococcaceae bacterium]